MTLRVVRVVGHDRGALTVLHLPAPRVLAPSVAVLLSLATGAALAHGSLSQATTGVYAAAAAVVCAWISAQTLLRILAVALMLVPVYVAPAFHGLPLLPAVVASWVLALVLISRNALTGARFRVTAIDVATALVFAAIALDVAVGGGDRRAAVLVAYLWLGPYLAGRLVASGESVIEAVVALAGAAVIVVPIAIAEAVYGFTLFGQAPDESTATRWGIPIERLGAMRAQAAFGHPIALSMVLAAAAILAFSASLNAHSQKIARGWQVVALALVVAQALAVSRTGWFVLGLALLIGFARRIRVSRRRLLLLAAAGVGALYVLPQRGAILAVIASLTGQTEHQALASNAAYRVGLLRILEHPLALPLVGNGSLPSSASVDNEFVLLGLQWGLVVLAPFVGLAVVLVVHGLRIKSDLHRFVVAAGAASIIALLAVAFITQQQVFIWLLVGICSAAVASAAGQAESLHDEP